MTIKKNTSKLNHVAIIMDGNNRWAKARDLTTQDGHRAGAENALKIIQAAIDHKISHLSLYAFSSENLKRPKEEVENFMGLLGNFAVNELDRVRQMNINLKFIGDLSLLDPVLRKNLLNAEKFSSSNSGIYLYVMVSYGSRAEIVSAARRIASQKLDESDITEEIFQQNLYHNLPDVDLLIRSGDNMRISNFLLWQSAYAEFFFSKKMWPDFSEEDFAAAINDYNSRTRTFGERNNA